MRRMLNSELIQGKALHQMNAFHPEVIEEIEKGLSQNEWVVVGMAMNPFVVKARKLLDSKNITYKYIQHGGYLSKWKERLAIKLWSGWPTFPQVFHQGKLIGGYQELSKSLQGQ
jgi:monothiol glutaredoxin